MSEIVLFHDEMLNPDHALIKRYPDRPRVFVFDTLQIERDHFSLRRLQFIADCVAEIPAIEVYKGPIGEVLRGLGVRAVATQRTPQLHIGTALSGFAVEWHDEDPFVEFRGRLKRFMHYWKAVEPQLVGRQAERDLAAQPVRELDSGSRRDRMRAIARDGAPPRLTTAEPSTDAASAEACDAEAAPGAPHESAPARVAEERGEQSAGAH